MGGRQNEQKEISPIEEISGVLHGQDEKINRLVEGLCEVSEERAGISSGLDALLDRVDKLCEDSGLDFHDEPRAPHLQPVETMPRSTSPSSWIDLVQAYDPFVQCRFKLDDLLPGVALTDIEQKFDAPLARKPWDKWDATVVFGAAMAGIIADWFCSPLGNPISDKLRSYGTKLHDNGGVELSFKSFQRSLREGAFAGRFQWVDKLANMDISHHNLPIDYTGKHFGGQYHRALSPGHDLMRFMSAIWQIKNGQFVGTRFENGQAIMEVVGVSDRGVAYSDRDWEMAAVLYLLHIIADFFTKTSLPVPGATLLRELPIREVRKFVSDMYEGKVNGVRSEHGGVNLRHLFGQSVTPAVVSLVIWLYYMIRYKIGGWWAVRKGSPHEEEAVKGLKLNEMLATAHTIVSGVNIGKVVITSNPTSLNIPELLVCLKQLYSLAMKTLERRNPKARFERNEVFLAEGWDRLEAYVMRPIGLSEIEWPSQSMIIA